MLQDIEKLLSRPLSSKEMTVYIEWIKDYNFSPEIILLLIQYCVSKGKTDWRYIEKIALGWFDAKIQTIDDAQMYIKKHEDKWVKIRKILNYLGAKDGEIKVFLYLGAYLLQNYYLILQKNLNNETSRRNFR